MKSATPASGQDGADDFVILGKISGVYGLRGWVKVYAETRERTLSNGLRVLLVSDPQASAVDVAVWYAIAAIVFGAVFAVGRCRPFAHL